MAKMKEKLLMISVVNNFEHYNNFILKNKFVESNENIECISFDNTNDNIFISKRYNEFLNSYDYSHDSWFVFCHADWEVLEDIVQILSNLKKNNIYGPIGTVGDFGNVVKNKFTRIVKGFCVEQTRDNNIKRISKTDENWSNTTVDTLDCQAMFVHSSLINKYNLRFDENLQWDLYVEDFCINAKKYGIQTHVVKIQCCHHSDAGFKEPPKSYLHMLDYLNKKYPNMMYAGICSPIGGKDVPIATDKDQVLAKLRKNITYK